MKTTITLFLMLVSMSCFAATLTVDNYLGGGQYSTIQDAINAASDDDVILVSPSHIEYDGFDCNKRLKIVGGGITATGNEYSASSTLLVYRTDVSFETGSEGSLMEGFGGGCDLFFNNDDIHLKNMIIASICNSEYPSLNGGHIIENCVFSGTPNSYRDYRVGYFSSVVVKNCLIYGRGSYACRLLYIADGNSVVINCIVLCDFADDHSDISTPTIINCFLDDDYDGMDYPLSPNIVYNMSSGDYLQGTTNQNNIPFESVFDEDYYPIANSPAIDAGHPDPGYNDLDGTRNDIGIFGGPLPYEPNGRPDLPVITELEGTMVTTPNEGLEINVRAQAAGQEE